MRLLLPLLTLVVLMTACEPSMESKLKEQMVASPTTQAETDKNLILQYAIDNKLDVESTASGIYYKKEIIVAEGASPGATDVVTVHYHGTLLDGKVFDSSVDRGEPIKFGLNQVIPGWTEAVQLMKKGEKAKVLIPSGLAYGERGAGKDIPPNTPLCFEIELIDFMDQAAAQAAAQAEALAHAKIQSPIDQKLIEEYNASKALKTQKTESGIHYIIEKAGRGDHPQPTSKVEVHYHGTLLDGTVFDSSVDRGKTISFGLDQVIPGWTEAIPLLKKGGKGKFIIPSHLAYGTQSPSPKIPPNSVLVFDVELISF